MNGKIYVIILMLAMIFLSGTDMVIALEPIPRESGFSGFIRPGAGYLSLKSNMVAKFLGTDLSEKRVNSLFDTPESSSSAIALVPFSLSYSFASSRTQIFVGTEPTDLIRFDFSQQVGVKQEIGKFGILQGGFLFNIIETKVWEDPYVAGFQDRIETDRKSNGGRLVWDQMFDLQLQLQYTYRKIDLGKERSGEFFGLNRLKRRLLNRNGDRHVGEVMYRFGRNSKHTWTPAFRFIRNEREGAAMASDAYNFQLTYSYFGDPFAITANLFFGVEDYDEINPIYNVVQNDEHLGLEATFYYKNPWGWHIFKSDPISFYINGAFVNIDANINFYDQQAILATAGLLFKW